MSAIVKNQNSNRLAMDRFITSTADPVAGPGSIRSPDGVSAAGGLGPTEGKDCMAVSAQARRDEG
jgi:hypothetical protein